MPSSPQSGHSAPRSRRTSRPTSGQPTPPRNSNLPSRASRSQVAFVVISSLVICSMVIGGVILAAQTSEIFDLDDQPAQTDDTDTIIDPNEDLIAEQQTVVAENPDDIDQLVLLANILGNSGRLSEAIPLYEDAIATAPDEHSIRLDFARALADGGMTPDARIQFERYLEMEPESQPGHFYYAELMRLMSPPDLATASHHYERVLEIDDTTYMAQRAEEELDVMDEATPVATPQATPDR